MEYCSQVWSPSQKYLVAKLERVQVKFIKYLCFKVNIPFHSGIYEDRCQLFSIPALKARRDVLDLCFLFKCINNIYDSPYILSEIPFHFPKRALRKHTYFKRSFYQINLRKYLHRVYDPFYLIAL